MFILTLLYVIIFYLQPGGRIPFLGAIRIELLIGSLILVVLMVKKGREIFKLTYMNKAILFFFAAVCMSFLGAFVTHTVSHAIEVLIQIVKYFSLYIMMISTIDTEKKLKVFLFVYLATIGFYFTEALVLGMYQYREDANHLVTIGQFGHYNSLGGITVSNLSFFFQMLFVVPWFLKVVIIALGGIAMQVIILTGSRTAYVGFIMLCILSIWFSKKRLMSLIVASVIAVTVFMSMPDDYKERFYSIGKTKEVVAGATLNDSIYTRWEILQDAFQIFIKYPIVGCGLDSFYQVRGELFNRWQQTHNLYMQVLTELGLLGFISFGYLIRVVFQYINYIKKMLLKLNKKKTFLYRAVVSVQIFMIMRMVVGMFGMDLYENYWWFIAGLTVAIYSLVKKEESIKSVLNA